MGGDFRAYLAKFQTSAAKLFLHHPNKKLKELSQALVACTEETKRRECFDAIRSYVEETQEYPFSVGLTWSISKEMLSPLTKHIFSYLCHCDPNSIFLDTLKFLVSPSGCSSVIDPDEFNESICELANYSLISYNRDSETVSMHRLVQQVELCIPDISNASPITILENIAYAWLEFWDNEYCTFNTKSPDARMVFYNSMLSLIIHINRISLLLEELTQNDNEIIKENAYILKTNFKVLRSKFSDNSELRNHILSSLNLQDQVEKETFLNFVRYHYGLNYEKTEYLMQEFNSIVSNINTLPIMLFDTLGMFSSKDENHINKIIRWVKKYNIISNFIEIMSIVTLNDFFQREDLQDKLKKILKENDNLKKSFLLADLVSEIPEIPSRGYSVQRIKFETEKIESIKMNSEAWKDAIKRLLKIFPNLDKMESDNILILINSSIKMNEDKWNIAVSLFSSKMNEAGYARLFGSVLDIKDEYKLRIIKHWDTSGIEGNERVVFVDAVNRINDQKLEFILSQMQGKDITDDLGARLIMNSWFLCESVYDVIWENIVEIINDDMNGNDILDLIESIQHFEAEFLYESGFPFIKRIVNGRVRAKVMKILAEDHLFWSMVACDANRMPRDDKYIRSLSMAELVNLFEIHKAILKCMKEKRVFMSKQKQLFKYENAQS